MYKYALLDPRPQGAASNDAVFEGAPAGVLGIEVTVPALAGRCTLGNIDPQHSGGNAAKAAIEEALVAAMPPEGATLVTVRPDLDSVGAMAILALRKEGMQFYTRAFWVRANAEMVAAADKFARGGYPGPRALPTKENPWPESGASAESSRPLAAIAACVADFKLPLGERVAAMERWLLAGEEPESYRARVEAERSEMIAALESGAINARTVADGRIAVVESTHRAATMVGYAMAPVVVAKNPAFKVGGGEPHTKFTVCVYEAGKFADIKSALAELATLETGWGGSPTIGGSPQAVSSTLTTEQVVEVVARHLKG